MFVNLVESVLPMKCKQVSEDRGNTDSGLSKGKVCVVVDAFQELSQSL